MSEDYQAYLAWTYFGKNAYDTHEFQKFAALLEGVKRFIDVGASHGIYTYHANKILTDADIYAIEADPERFAFLSKNAEKWAAESSNRIHCIHAASSDEADRSQSKEVTFFTTGTQISGGLFGVPERADEYTECTLPLVTVDDFFDASQKTFVKIDVEGAELRVLKGAARHFAERKAVFFTEIAWWGDRDRGTSALDVLRFCLKSGMRVDRRLRSDYLLQHEPSSLRRLMSVANSLRPLLVRVIWNTFVPLGVRRWRERRDIARRLARYKTAGVG